MRFFNAGVVALIISALALVVSLTTLWLTHFSPAHLEVSHASLRLTGYPPSAEEVKEGSLFIRPSIDVEMAFYNSGQRTAEVLGLRIRLHIRGDHYGNHKDSRDKLFHPMWVVNRSTFQAKYRDREKWYRGAVEHEWFRLLVPGKTTIYQHIVFEGRPWPWPSTIGADLELDVLERGKPWRIVSSGQHTPLDISDHTTRSAYATPSPFDMSESGNSPPKK